jgi:hypothetical protein
MGTMIQPLGFDEAAFRGERFANHGTSVRGCNDLLVLTQPAAIEHIHLEFLRAGADIVETNTFGATAIAAADYKLESRGRRPQPSPRPGRAPRRRARRARGRQAALGRRLDRADHQDRVAVARRQRSRLPRRHVRAAGRRVPPSKPRRSSTAASICC